VKPERAWLLAAIKAQPDITLAALSLRVTAAESQPWTRITTPEHFKEHY